MDPVFDLFGDPVPANFGGRGRPQHIPTQENRNKVKLLLALGWGNERIARALSVTLPTLRKHYFSLLKYRDEQRDRMTAQMAMRLWSQVQEGSVAAIKEMQAFVEKNDLMTYGQAPAPQQLRQTEPKAPKLGKKDQALADAHNPDDGTPLGELMRQRQGGAVN